MNEEFKNKLLELLEIIGYENDKEKFIDNFLETVSLQALNSLVTGLPLEEQSKIKVSLSSVKSEDDLKKILENAGFPKEKYMEALQNAVKNVFSDLVISVRPTVNEQQKQKLDLYLADLVKMVEK